MQANVEMDANCKHMQTFTNVHNYLQANSNVLQIRKCITKILWFAKVCISLCMSLQKFAYVCKSLPMLSKVCICLQKFAKVCKSLPMLSKVCIYLQKFAFPCIPRYEIPEPCPDLSLPFVLVLNWFATVCII